MLRALKNRLACSSSWLSLIPVALGASLALEATAVSAETASATQPQTVTATDTSGATKDASRPAAAAASQNAAQLGEILVTARLRAESVQTVPEQVSVITTQVLKDNNITNFYNLQGFAPSVAVSTNYVRDYSTVVIRGFAASAYINEVPTQPYSLYDLSDVQFFYGPQGTLFGYTAKGGAVLYTTHRPEMDHFGTGINVTLGNLHETDVDGYINIPLVEDKLAARFSFGRFHTDGFTRIQNDDRLLDSNDSNSARLIIEWRPTSKVTDDIYITGVRQSNTTTSRIVTGINPLFPAFDPINSTNNGTTPTGVNIPNGYTAGFFGFACTPSILAATWAPGTTANQCENQHLAVTDTLRQDALTAIGLNQATNGRVMPKPNENGVLRQLADNVQANNIFNWDALHWDNALGGGEVSVHDIFSAIYYRNYINNFTGGGGAFDYYGTAFITSAGNVFPTPHVTLQPCAADGVACSGRVDNPQNSFGSPTLGGWVPYYQNELQIHGTLDDNLGRTPGVTYVLGMYSYWINTGAKVQSTTNLPISFNGIFTPNEGPVPCCNAPLKYSYTTQAEYLNATLDLGMFSQALSGLHVTGGFRYTSNNQTLLTLPFVANYAAANVWNVNTAAAPISSPAKNAELNWSGSIDYTTQNNMVYFNVAQVVDPGGTNVLPGTVPANLIAGYIPSFGEAQLRSYEVGDKFHIQLDNGMRGYLDVDAYRMEYTGIQIPLTVYIQSLGTYASYTGNFASALYQGLEFQGEWLIPHPDLGIYGSLSLSDDHYTKYLRADPDGTGLGLSEYIPTVGGNPSGSAVVRQFSTVPGAVNSPLCNVAASLTTVLPGQTVGTCLMDFSKSPIPNAPRVQASVRLRYTLPLGAYGDLVNSLTVAYQSKMYLTAAQPILREAQLLGPQVYDWSSQQAHTDVNLNMSWNHVMGNDNLRASFWVRNLLNTTYRQGLIDTLFVIGVESNDYNPPRQFGVTLSATY